MRVELQGQKQVFWTVVFSIGFFVYGISSSDVEIGSNMTTLAKAEAPSRGIASE